MFLTIREILSNVIVSQYFRCKCGSTMNVIFRGYCSHPVLIIWYFVGANSCRLYPYAHVLWLLITPRLAGRGSSSSEHMICVGYRHLTMK